MRVGPPLSIALLTLTSAVSLLGADRPEGSLFATRSVVFARHGMVAAAAPLADPLRGMGAAAHPLAVQIGVDVLKSGGTAVDAAIAVNAALGFLEPVSCGIGG